MKKLSILFLSAFLFAACNDYSIFLNSNDYISDTIQIYYCSSLSQVKTVIAENTHTKIIWDNIENKVSENSFDYAYREFTEIFTDNYLKAANWDTWQDGYYVRISKFLSPENIRIYYLKFDSRIPVTSGNKYLKKCKVYLL